MKICSLCAIFTYLKCRRGIFLSEDCINCGADLKPCKQEGKGKEGLCCICNLEKYKYSILCLDCAQHAGYNHKLTYQKNSILCVYCKKEFNGLKDGMKTFCPSQLARFELISIKPINQEIKLSKKHDMILGIYFVAIIALIIFKTSNII